MCNQALIWVFQEAVFVSHHVAVGDLAVSTVRYKDSSLDKHYPVEDKKAVQTRFKYPEDLFLVWVAQLE